MKKKKTLPIALLLLLLTLLQNKVAAQVGNAEILGIVGDILTCNNFQSQSVGAVEGGMPGTLTGITFGTNIAGRRTECYFFDAMFNLVKHRNIFGGEMSYDYDHLDRILSKETGLLVNSYFYNGYSNLKRVETLGALPYLNNADPDFEQHFVYNDRGLMEKRIYGRADNDGNMQRGLESRTQYNADDLPTASIGPGGAGTCIAERNASGKPTRIVGAGING